MSSSNLYPNKPDYTEEVRDIIIKSLKGHYGKDTEIEWYNCNSEETISGRLTEN